VAAARYDPVVRATEAAAAAARRSWPVRLFRLGEEPSEDLSASTNPEQRLAMMWPLAREAFSLAGRPDPLYERSDSPVALRRLGE
jgi:hypothetical protein